MNRLFAILASLNGLVLLAAFGVGWLSKYRGAAANPSDPTFLYHFWLGLGAALITLLVHCLIFTYFLGTGRWVKEVGIAYQLDDAGLPRETRELKRKVFPAALIAMLVTIATSAAGSGAQLQEWPWQVHATLACITLLVNGWAYSVELGTLRPNGLVLQRVLEEVDRIRASAGLPSNAEAIEQERHA